VVGFGLAARSRVKISWRLAGFMFLNPDVEPAAKRMTDHPGISACQVLKHPSMVFLAPRVAICPSAHYNVPRSHSPEPAMRSIAKVLCALLAAVALPIFAQQVVVEKDSDLRGAANHSAPVVGKVKQGTNGEVTDKSGAWVNLKTPDAAGWLFSFNVRFAGASAAGGGGGDGGAGLVSRLTGPRTNVSVTSTLGTRGLDKESLAQGTFNAGEMKLLDSYATTKESAQEGARVAGLEATRVEYVGAK
jgi:hypothetical protein